MAIRVHCKVCSTEVDSTELRDMVCAECRVRAFLALDLAAYGAAWRKLERYRAKGLPCSSIQRQWTRLGGRIVRKCHEAIPDGETARDFANRLLENERVQISRVTAIRAARVGELFRAEDR